MGFTESPTQTRLPWDTYRFKRLMEKLNWTSVNNVFCASSSEMVLIWIVFSVDVLVMCLALYGLSFKLRSNHALPIFVINLFICDIIQICIKPALHLCYLNYVIFILFNVYIFSIICNIGFMVCISMERYIMIKYPVWYRLHHTWRNSIVVCLLVWASLFGFVVLNVIVSLDGDLYHAFLSSVFVFLLPYPIVVFCFVGSWKALAHSVAVSPDERKRILKIQALVLFNYTLLFMPSIVQNVFAVSFTQWKIGYFECLHSVSGILLYLNPLADSLLYVFVWKGNGDIFWSFCCKTFCENQN